MPTDPETVEQLIHEYGGRLYTFCRRLAAAPADADDLYQQTYLRILDMPGSIDLANNPAGFLMTVAARIWRDEQKKFARRQRIAPVQFNNDGISLASGGELTEALAEKHQVQSDVRSAVQKLPETLRVPVLLYYTGNLPVHEIAKALRIPQGTVKSRLHQARRKLKAELEGIGYEG